MKTKISRAKRLFVSGDTVGAMKLFSSFKFGFSTEEQRIIQIAYESQIGNAKFYQDIGINTDAVLNNAKEIIRFKYSI